MANYLPVLLNTHVLTVPDDSALNTAPRAQVDYLSHDWLEEDVWRSWRNMTRQKNEIANGARLENASWRTWWKQRNNLPTVSPETLNWLKDSDVTWLYGPLHTAVDWTPPPKPPPVPDSVDHDPASAVDRLDLSPSSVRRPAPYKPILKHRSISQLLISDLPASPLFSPEESEEETELPDESAPSPLPAKPLRPSLVHTKSDTYVTRWKNRAFRKDSPPRIDPALLEQSRLAPNTGGQIRSSLSQDSNSSASASGSNSASNERSHSAHKKKHISFNTFVEQCIAIEKPKKNASGFFGFGMDDHSRLSSGRTHWVDDEGYEEDQEDSDQEELVIHGSQWQRSGTSTPRNDSESPSPVREDIDEEVEDTDDHAIEIRSSSIRSATKPPKKKPPPRSQSKASTTSSSSSASTNTTSTSSTASTPYSNSSPSGSLSPTRRSSSTSMLHGKTSSIYTNAPRRVPSSSNLSRRSSTSTYRPGTRRYPPPPPIIRTPSDSQYPHHPPSYYHQPVTIAPIAPTILKTTNGVPPPGWMSDDDSGAGNDDGYSSWAWGVGGAIGIGNDQTSLSRTPSTGPFGTGRAVPIGIGLDLDGTDDNQGSDGTPVELVYVPPLGSRYDLGFGDEDVIEDDGELQLEDVSLPASSAAIKFASPFATPDVTGSMATPQVPTVVVDATTPSPRRRRSNGSLPQPAFNADGEMIEDDPYDYFEGPDMGEDYFGNGRSTGRGYNGHYVHGHSSASRGKIPSPISTSPSKNPDSSSHGLNSHSSAAAARQRERERERKSTGNGEERQSRSRSRSQSRTPSPALITSSTLETTGEVPIPISSGRKRSGSASSPSTNGLITSSGLPSSRTPSSSDLLVPPTRGRQIDGVSLSSSYREQSQGRGRSSTRTPSSSSSSWERDRSSGRSGSLGSTSPIGSLSPDVGRVSTGSSGIGIAAALAGNGRDRHTERERGKDSQRGRERRGRERVSGKILGASEVSDSSSTVASSLGSSNSSKEQDSAKPSTGHVIAGSALHASFSSASSSTNSSSSTVMAASQTATEMDATTPTVGSSVNTPTPTNAFDQDMELMFMRRAEEESRRRAHLTPSNSPIIELKMAGVWDKIAPSPASSSTPSVSSAGRSVSTAETTPTSGTPMRTPISLSEEKDIGPSLSSAPVLPSSSSPPRSDSLFPAPISPSKLRPPPLIPSPPGPAKPSTSFTAVSSPLGTLSPSATSSNPGSETIVSKAVDMVSSAGAYFGLWGGSSASVAATSP